MHEERAISQLHHEMIRTLADTGSCPSNEVLAGRLAISRSEVENRLKSLADCHGVVLHPYGTEPWVLHPFSLTPTLHWVEGRSIGWWAPCIWCALGIATIVGGQARIHTRIAGEGEALVIPVKEGIPVLREECFVHFAVPPAQAWRNVHEHCSMVLPFRSERDIEAWSARHRLPNGQAVPLNQVALLARKWYGNYASPDWRKWTVSEASQIFREVGLLSEFWSLENRNGSF
jgi:hypothetical protein